MVKLKRKLGNDYYKKSGAWLLEGKREVLEGHTGERIDDVGVTEVHSL